MKPKSTDACRQATLKSLLLEVTGHDSARLLTQFEQFRTLDQKGLINDDPDSQCFIGMTTDYALSLLALDLGKFGWGPESIHRLRLFLMYALLNAKMWQGSGCLKADVQGKVADHSGLALMASHWASYIFASVGEWDKAKWLANYILDFYEAGGIRWPREGDQHDGPYYHVLRLLLTALRDGQWPPVFGEELGPYQALLQNRCDPEAVKVALVPVMDLRMARNNGYPDVDAPKRLHSLDSNVIGGTTYTVLPADLWAIQALTHRLDGCAMRLEGDHPWLQAPFMQPPPSSLEPWSDELTEQLIRVGDERFPPGWLSDDPDSCGAR